MKELLALIAILSVLTECGRPDRYTPRNGDIIFQTSLSSQSVAIQRATKSKYSHMGIVYLQDSRPLVFEAAGSVRLTPLDDWVARGEGGRFIVKRLSESDELLSDKSIERMLSVGKTFSGKGYDPYFEWSDERMYCSEVVWKIFKRALNIEIGELQTMQDFDLSDSLVKAKIHERFGDSFPIHETVISPAAIFDSKLLVTVYEQ